MLRKLFEQAKAPAAQKLSRKDPDFKTPLPDFKGQRRDPWNYKGGIPSSKISTEMRYRHSPALDMQPRDIRIKTWLALFAFIAWYVGVFTFIAHRLSSDDLDTLEKDARQQIEIRKKIKQEFIDDEE
ncbi:unnamed protein product [Blepharisma stoltei]|uniref:Uncharacterized protein n=1 Tax=Blepharisma stoltei TaxID=1481888 RepID=A0AAU9KMD7_9CILI|nr:unnamed protein product [Blepharisma stoltei]